MRLRVESLRAAWKGDGSSAPALPRVVFAAKCVCLAPLLPAAGLAGEPSGADETLRPSRTARREPVPRNFVGDASTIIGELRTIGARAEQRAAHDAGSGC